MEPSTPTGPGVTVRMDGRELMEFVDPPPEGHFQLVGIGEYGFNVHRDLLMQSELLQAWVELADLDEEAPAEERHYIRLGLTKEVIDKLSQTFILVDRLIENSEFHFEEGQTQLQLSQTLRISEHFQFNDLSQRIRLVLAQRLADAEPEELHNLLGVSEDMSKEDKLEAERNCGIFK